MTDDEAIERARRLAQERGWPWEGRVDVARSRAFVFFGTRRIEVRSNVGTYGARCHVTLEEPTGDVVASSFFPRQLTDEEAIEKAREIATSRSWAWRGLVEVTRGASGPHLSITVRSNVDMKGCNCRIVLDAISGELLDSGYLAR